MFFLGLIWLLGKDSYQGSQQGTTLEVRHVDVSKRNEHDLEALTLAFR